MNIVEEKFKLGFQDLAETCFTRSIIELGGVTFNYLGIVRIILNYEKTIKP